MIWINGDYSFQPYSHGWELHSWYDSKDRKTGETKRASKVTYHARLDQVGRKYLNLVGKECEDMEGLMETLEKAQEEFVAVARSINV